MDNDADVVRSNVMALFNLPLRSRVMRPKIGTLVHMYAFENFNGLTQVMLEREIRATFSRGEPRAAVRQVKVSQSGTKIIADIIWSVNGIEEQLKVLLSETGA